MTVERATQLGSPSHVTVLPVARARLEAVAAVDGLVRSRLERDLGYLAAAAAGRLEHLARTRGVSAGVTLLLARVAAIGAAVRFVLEPFAGKEFLLAGAECELAVAVNAIKGFVGIQGCMGLPASGGFRLARDPSINQPDRACFEPRDLTPTAILPAPTL